MSKSKGKHGQALHPQNSPKDKSGHSGEAVSPDLPPTPHANYNAHGSEDNTPRRKRGLELASFAISVLALVVAVFQSRSAQKSAEAAKRSAEEATANFIKDQRPYVSVPDPPRQTIKVQVGQHVRWDVIQINSGRSPAVDGAMVAGVWVGRSAYQDVEKFFKWGSRLAPPLITLRFHPVVAMCDVRFGDRPRDYRLFEKSPENEPTCVWGSPIETEGELLQIGLQVLGNDGSLVGAEDPSLEPAGDVMHAWHRNLRRVIR